MTQIIGLTYEQWLRLIEITCGENLTLSPQKFQSLLLQKLSTVTDKTLHCKIENLSNGPCGWLQSKLQQFWQGRNIASVDKLLVELDCYGIQEVANKALEVRNQAKELQAMLAEVPNSQSALDAITQAIKNLEKVSQYPQLPDTIS